MHDVCTLSAMQVLSGLHNVCTCGANHAAVDKTESSLNSPHPVAFVPHAFRTLRPPGTSPRPQDYCQPQRHAGLMNAAHGTATDLQASVDLKREAAHNLVQAFMATGSRAMAMQVMREHLTI